MQNDNDIKTQIVEAAILLYRKNGIRRTSVDDVCRELRISKKTFYACFATKEALLEELLTFFVQKICEKYEKNLHGKSAIECMLAMIKETYKISEKHDTIIHHDVAKYYPKLLAKFKKQVTTMCREGFEYNLKQGIAEGFYRADLDVEMLSAFQVFYVNSKVNNNFETHLSNSFSRKRILDFFNDVYIRIIVNEKGMKYFEENYYSKKSL
ncbi:MAG: TetR/AcrR family transcriptional regulator [Prevotellaceae bacterium]|jgi:AcrR family transcriptional regulator|nr:TetR/AcrR family transcriptional regulator [Prevotellaceae bacterium]